MSETTPGPSGRDLPQDVRDGLRHMAALFASTQALRGMLAGDALAEVDAAIAWVYKISIENIQDPPA